MWEEKDIKKVLYSQEQIIERCKELGAQIKADYEHNEQPLLLVALLRGSVSFLAELIKHIDLDIQ
ncbi:MAG: hypoxanthine phosphoribosyltransferase, partial [Solobacterium sp.]|nr:hypoxanthine phosphoribosyltransferase [Solobacterium sp.]